jgi:hypothetical protein
MGQVTIYLPQEIERQFRREVRRKKTTMSAYIASLGRQEHKDALGWPDGFAELFGSLKGMLKAPADPPPEVPRFVPAIPDRHQRVHRVSRRRRRPAP